MSSDCCFAGSQLIGKMVMTVLNECDWSLMRRGCPLWALRKQCTLLFVTSAAWFDTDTRCLCSCLVSATATTLSVRAVFVVGSVVPDVQWTIQNNVDQDRIFTSLIYFSFRFPFILLYFSKLTFDHIWRVNIINGALTSCWESFFNFTCRVSLLNSLLSMFDRASSSCHRNYT